jgi:dihydrofolate reductase
MATVHIIVATDINNGISKNKQIPWLNEEWSRDDLKRFKEITNNGIIICGRNTYTEIAALRPVSTHILPNRITYVITSNVSNYCAGATTASSISDVIQQHLTDNIFIIGGESLFNEGLEYADKIHITQSTNDYDCDQFFNFDLDKFELLDTILRNTYSYCIYQKKS